MILLDSIIRSSVVVTIALFAVSILLRKRSASLRHFVLSMAVLVAAVTPALTVLLPSLNLGRLVVQPEVSEPLFVESTVLEETTTRVVKAGWFPNQPADFIAPIWLAGVLLSLTGLVAGGIRLARIVSVSQSVTNGNWTASAERICRSYGLPRRVRLLQTKNPSILVTWGLLKPRILLPAGADGWTEDRVQAVLSHELAHIRRHDWLIQLAAETLRTVYWFNPSSGCFVIVCAWKANTPAMTPQSVRASRELNMPGTCSTSPALSTHLVDRGRPYWLWLVHPPFKGDSAPC